MKELEGHKPDDKEIVREIRDHTEVLIGSNILPRGCFWWELNLDGLKFTKATYTDERVELFAEKSLFGWPTGKMTPIKRKDLITKDNHLYVIASNARNAKRKFLKIMKNEQDKEKIQVID